MELLFICTHNRCRSILCEAITREMGDGQLEARSAGSAPVDEVHPLTLKYLTEAGISTSGLYSKSWDNLDEYQPDLLITVCDSAAGETCPLYLGSALRLHWGLEDPSRVSGSDEAIATAFRNTIAIIEARTARLAALVGEGMSGPDIAALITATPGE